MIRKIASLTVLVCAAFGQPAAPLTFSVASIRPHPDPSHSIGISTSGNRLTVEASYVGVIILYAYNLKNYQLDTSKSLPANDTMYDIAAKAEGDGTPTRDEFRQMLQSLLADRFKLKVHREMREIPVYALVIGKTGPRFKETAPDAPLISNHGVNGRNQNVTMSHATMGGLADDIENFFFADRPVLDKTGLLAKYGIKLEATPELRLNNNPQPGDVSIFDAIQQQLGLKLEPQKAMLEIVVVDRVEKPSAN